MRRIKIALDLDGVVYEFQRTCLYMLREYRGYTRDQLDISMWTDWDWPKTVVSSDDWDWLWTEGVELGLFRYGHVTTGALVGIDRLELRYDIGVVTHRPRNAISDTLEWISFLDKPFSFVHILSDGKSKASIDADILVDDKPENIVEWAATGRRAVVYDRPWNHSHLPMEKSLGVRRVYSWQAIPETVKSL